MKKIKSLNTYVPYFNSIELKIPIFSKILYIDIEDSTINLIYEFDSENNVYFVDWSELPHDEEIKVIDLHDDYFFNIHFSNSEDVKNFFRFILKESYLFLNLKPSDAEILASENILFEHLSQDAIDCFFRFRVCKSQNSIMIGYETVSKNKLKKFLHITDKIKIQIL